MINNIRARFRGFKRKRVEPSQLKQLVDELLSESSLDATYLILIIGSCAIATFGLLANSTAVIIGAMIIAPLMLPIRGLAFGALIGNISLFRKGVIAVFLGTLLALVISCSIGWIVNLPSFGSEVLSNLTCLIWVLQSQQVVSVAMLRLIQKSLLVWQGQQ